MSVKRLALAFSLFATSALAQPASGPMLGFGDQGAQAERALERRLDASVQPGELDGWLLRMASAPNQVGSPHDRDNAEWQLAQFKSWGWDAHIETFQVLYPTPLQESVDLLGPHPYHARLHEPNVAGDQTPAEQPGVLPPYLAYQGDGDVTAPLVYVNYGMPDDYRQLARQGIDVRGKIVIARYGGGWRGLKPKLAQTHGAVGCIIYSDPHEDGFYTDDPYPAGAQRPAQGVQRGSVQDITYYSGDPLTPGVAATPDARRLTRETAPTILKIPAIPMSWSDAQPLLAALGGPVAAPSFRGALPLTYHLGPGPMVHLVVKSDWSLKPLYDVVATMKGSELPDEWVVRGNHHDGWVFGAQDPLSGQVALMAEAKAMGELARTGWRPKRTVIYCSWDGEEPGLLGSTEWVEAHADDLARHAVMYVNSDDPYRGYLGLSGSHELQTLANQAAMEVGDPETGSDILARRRAHLVVDGLDASGPHAEEARTLGQAAAGGGPLPIQALGSGSDYTPFLQHLGVPSLDVNFGDEAAEGGAYHSAYDTHDHYVRFYDPGMKYSATLARTAGRIVLRYADAEAAPLDFTALSAAVGLYVGEVKRLADHAREEAAARDRALASGAYRLDADPLKADAAPERLAEVPAIDFSPLEQASARLTASAARFQRLYASASLTAAQRGRLGAAVQGIDQSLVTPGGLPGRPWYRHVLYAPGTETGYGVKTLPAVREAIEQRRYAELPSDIALTAAALNAYAARLDAASGAAGG